MMSVGEKLDVLIERTDMLMRDTLPGELLDSLFPGEWHQMLHGNSYCRFRTYVPQTRGYLEIELIDDSGFRVWCKRFTRDDRPAQ